MNLFTTRQFVLAIVLLTNFYSHHAAAQTPTESLDSDFARDLCELQLFTTASTHEHTASVTNNTGNSSTSTAVNKHHWATVAAESLVDGSELTTEPCPLASNKSTTDLAKKLAAALRLDHDLIEKSISTRTPIKGQCTTLTKNPQVFTVHQPTVVLISAEHMPPTRTRAVFLDIDTGNSIEAEWYPLVEGGSGLTVTIPKGTWRISTWSKPRVLEGGVDLAWEYQYAFMNDINLGENGCNNVDPVAGKRTLFGQAYVARGSSSAKGLQALVPGATDKLTRINFYVLDTPELSKLQTHLFSGDGTGTAKLSTFRSASVGTTIANEVLGTLANVIVLRANRQARRLIEEKLEDWLGCNQKTAGLKFNRVCSYVQTLELEAIAANAEDIVKAIQLDILQGLADSLKEASSLEDGCKAAKKTIALVLPFNPNEISCILASSDAYSLHVLTNTVIQIIDRREGDSVHAIHALLDLLRSPFSLIPSNTNAKNDIAKDQFAYQVAIALVYICQQTRCDSNRMNQILDHPEKWLTSSNNEITSNTLLSTHRDFAQRLVHVLDPSSSLSDSERVIITLDLVIEASAMQKEASILRDLYAAALEQDPVKLLVVSKPHLKNWVCHSTSDHIKQCKQEVERGIDLIATLAVMVKNGKDLDPASLAAQREARTELVESYIDGMTERRHRMSDPIVSVWGAVETQTRFISSTEYNFGQPITHTPLRIPLGLALQIPLCIKEDPKKFANILPTLHFAFTPLDLGQYIKTEEDGTYDFDPADAISPTLSLGILLSYKLPIYAAMNARWLQPEERLEPTQIPVGINLSLGFSVPLLDLN